LKIEKEKVVVLKLVLKDEKNQILEATDDKHPLAYIHGSGEMVPGIEKALDNKKVGSKVSKTIGPKEGYGDYREEWVQTAPLENFDDPIRVKVGVQFQAKTDNGVRIATVTKIEDKSVTIDMNHPYAGKSLSFDAEVLEVREATKEEKEHGHVHGLGGHHH